MINGASLLYPHTRVDLAERLSLLLCLKGEKISLFRCTWVLLMTHSALEEQAAKDLTQALVKPTSWCRGVRVVHEARPEEGGLEGTANAAIELHRLHFPAVPEHKRPARILVLGGFRERELLKAMHSPWSDASRQTHREKSLRRF